MSQRCAWTGKRADELNEVWFTVPNRWGGSPHEERFLVSPEHENELHRYTQRLTRYGRLYVFLVIADIVAAVTFAALGSMTGIAASLLGMGLILVVLPFATPETVQVEGVRRSVRNSRMAGLILAALAVGLLL